MSRYNDAQFELVYATIDSVAQDRGYDRNETESLQRRVFNDDRLWDSDIWGPLYEFVSDCADGFDNMS